MLVITIIFLVNSIFLIFLYRGFNIKSGYFALLNVRRNWKITILNYYFHL